MAGSDGFFFDPNELAGKQIINTPSLVSDPCLLCGLHKTCLAPKLGPIGEGKQGVLVIGDSPDADEDKSAILLSGKSGDLLKQVFSLSGLNLLEDCWYTNVLCCYSKGNFQTDKVEYCFDRLEMLIESIQPKLIVCVGQNAMTRILQTSAIHQPVSVVRGDVFPSRIYGCWIAVTLPPDFVVSKREAEKMDLIVTMSDDVAKALTHMDDHFSPSIVDDGRNHLLIGEEAYKMFEYMAKSNNPVSFDYETEGVTPYVGETTPKDRLVSVALSNHPGTSYVVFMNDSPLHWDGLRLFLQSPAPKVSHNYKFEELWGRTSTGASTCNWYWDTMLAAHVLDERKGKKNLEYQTYLYTGEEYKQRVNRKNIRRNSNQAIVTYNGLDSRTPLIIMKKQQELIKQEGLEYPLRFLMEGTEALADIEHHGVKVDREAAKELKLVIDDKLAKAQMVLDNSDCVAHFIEKYNHRPNFGSNPDLQRLFFGVMGKTPLTYTEPSALYPEGQPQVDDGFLEGLRRNGGDDGIFAGSLQDVKSLSKMDSTYFKNLDFFVDGNDFVHPNYNLGLVETYRSSSDSPNIQNMPKRDPLMRQFRRLFIASNDFLLDTDYSGAEVVIQAMMAQDVVLCKQIMDGVDIHRFWASKIFDIPENEVTKPQRQRAKNELVFPFLYGSYWRSVARNMGLPEAKIQAVEVLFWQMYAGVKAWQDARLSEYQEYGYVSTPLGFRRRGPLSRNQIMNTPIQGTAFHCLMDALIRARRIFIKEQMKSAFVLEVHDEFAIDTVASEERAVLDIVTDTMVNKPHWDWTKSAKLSCEWKKGLNWFEMEKVA